MRKLILAMQMSIDGFIEGPNGDMSFLETDTTDLWGDLFGMLPDIDLLLLGRVMYPGYSGYWKDCLTNPGKHSAEEVKYAQWADKTQHVVFSQTLTTFPKILRNSLRKKESVLGDCFWENVPQKNSLTKIEVNIERLLR